MLKVVSVSDKKDTAIDRLCRGVIPYHSNLDYTVCDVHPKRPDPEQLQRFEQAALTADIIDFQYFRTAQMLIERYPWLKDKILLLTHNNGYSWKDGHWDEFTHVVANNHTMKQGLEKVMHNPAERLSYIPLATDPMFWKFNFDWTPTKRVIMVANRIEGKKGILEAAIACGDLGLTFVLVGAVSDREYLHSIYQTGNVEFHEQCSDEELRNLYYSAAVHICNSVDDFESGTLPILEAMQCGVPVLTRNVGHVPDLYNGENMVLLDGQPTDIEGIKNKLEDMINDAKALEEMRQKAWNTAKNFNYERRAYSYQRLYRQLLPGEPVSIIVPVYDKPDTVRACLNAIAQQDYTNLEVIVVNDSSTNVNEILTQEFAHTVDFPVRYINGYAGDYGLARARNLGIIEATADILVFNDQRMIMATNAVTEFVKHLIPKTWLFGDKNGKTNFIENFSCVSRSELITAGMFNERITAYGGMSQEVRQRTREQGFKHILVESAKATPMGKSGNKNQKKEDIYKMKNLLWKCGL